MKFYLDGDEYPTINGTGTETYPGDGWCFRECTYGGPFSATRWRKWVTPV